MQTLNELGLGVRARVVTVNGGSAPRLLALGLLPGVTLEITGLAPLGDPLHIKLDNRSTLSLRRADAAQVEVEYMN